MKNWSEGSKSILSQNQKDLLAIIFITATLIMSGFFASQQAFAKTDAAAPVAISAQTKTTTTIDVTFSEDLNGSSDNPADFTVAGSVVFATSELNGVVTLTLGNPIATDAIPLITVHGNGVNSGLKDLNNNWTTEHSVAPTDGIAPIFTAETLTTTTIQVIFSENVEGGTVANAWTVGGTPATAASDPGGTNSLTLTVPAMGTGATPVVAYVAVNGDIADTVANEVADGTSDVAEDGIDPTVSITSTATSSTKTSPIPMTVTFSEAVGGFVVGDITVSNGIAGNFMVVSGLMYTFDVTPTNQGAVTVDVAGDVAQDGVLNDNTVANQFTIVYDTEAPSVTSKTPGANAVGIALSTNITVTFSEDVVVQDADVAITPGNPAKTITFNPETNVATINPDANLNDNTTYTITLDGVTDTSGNLLPPTIWSFTTTASYSINLTTGWNLISLPVVPTDTAASAVLGALDDTAIVQSVFMYDAINEEWLVYHPDSPETSSFSTINTGTGYWIDYLDSDSATIAGTGNLFLEGANTPPQKELAAGWNLIGYYQLENTTDVVANVALSTLDDQWTQLRTYDNELKQFQSVIGSDNMSPGKGYWIFMKSTTIATYIYGPGDAS